MKLSHIIHLFWANKMYTMVLPILVGAFVFIYTSNMSKEYTSKATIYTAIASTNSNDIENSRGLNIHEVASNFDNLLACIASNETNTEVSVTLLATVLHNNSLRNELYTVNEIGNADLLKDEQWIALNRKNTIEATKTHLHSMLKHRSDKRLFEMVTGLKKNIFNLNAITKVKASRVGFSDVLQLEYSSPNATISKKTLDVLIETFIKKYKDLRVSEASNSIAYFQKQTKLAFDNLNVAEEDLKQYRTQNGILNYYEQTKYLADQKEDFEIKQNTLEMNLQGYKAAIVTLENKLKNRHFAQIKNNEIVEKRTALSKSLQNLARAEVESLPNVNGIKEEIEDAQNDLKSSLNELYSLNNSTEGVASKAMLDQWMVAVVEFETTKSQLKVLERNKSNFTKEFSSFAPKGSSLNKLEREVSTAEKTYLNLLHNLNQAILRAKNMEESNNITTLDEPSMPVNHNPTKRLLLVIGAIIGSLVLVTAIIGFKVFFNQKIVNPSRLTQLTGLRTATALGLTCGHMDSLQLVKQGLDQWLLKFLKHRFDFESKCHIVVPIHDNNCLDEYLHDLAKMAKNENLDLELAWGQNFQKSDLCLLRLYHRQVERANRSDIEKCDTVYLVFNADEALNEADFDLINNWKTTGLHIEAVLLNTSQFYLNEYLSVRKVNKTKKWAGRAAFALNT